VPIVDPQRFCWLLPLGLLVALAGGACGNRDGGRGPPAGVVPVERVVDGDTIQVRFLGRDERVRLIGVDTPEVSWYGGQGDCFGERAGLYTRARLSGRTVRLVFDVDRRDRYGRLLAYVYLGSELFNLTLVQRGYAEVETVPPDTRLARVFEAAAGRARSAGLGLWSACS
jgi:micrococcal nuclease